MPTAVDVTVLTLCPGCDEIHDGPGDHCDHCFTHGLCDAGRERSMALTRLLLPRPAQRDYIIRLIEIMEDRELQELVLRMFHYLAPIERSALLSVAAEIADMRPFREGRRPCR
jgi:hypothetical protein